MAAKVTIVLEAPDDALTGYGAGALIRLQSAATEAGVYANVTTIPVVAATPSYVYWDNAGDTTTWYRWRLENAAATETGEYSDSFHGTDPALGELGGAYADVDDVLLTFRSPPTDPRFRAAIARLAIEVSRDLDREVGYSVLPGVSQTWIVHGTGDRRLHVHGGITSLASVEVRTTSTGDWVLLDDADWFLEGDYGSLETVPGEPSFHVVMFDATSYPVFPNVRQGVRLTGVPGWPSIPTDWRAATVAWIRQRLSAQNLLPGGQAGPDELGSAFAPDRKPQIVYDLLVAERHRFWCHL